MSFEIPATWDEVYLLFPKQKCEKCRGWYDRDVAFRRSNLLAYAGRKNFHPVCVGCEQTERDTLKHKDPFIEKAHATVRGHAQRRGIKKAEFISLYGWDIKRVAHILRHGYENTCTYCRRLYSTMLNGIRDITMDIIDPAREPFLETNTTACCQTCNSSKRDMPPDMWARKLRFWREWEANQLRMPQPPIQLNLIDLLPLALRTHASASVIQP